MRLKVLGVLCLLSLFVPTAVEQLNETQPSPLVSGLTVSTAVVTTTTTAAPTTTTTLPPTTTSTLPITTTTSTVFTSPVVSVSESTEIWDHLCSCECGGECNWSIDAYHDGGLQFHPKTWTDYVAAGKPYGLVGYPQYAYQATREQQITVAIRVRDGVEGSSNPYLNAQGWNAWPTCRHKVGV